MNFSGSLGGKYGASTHFSAHLRLRILQAAQGLTTGTGGGVAGGGGEEEDREELVVVVTVVSLDDSMNIML